MFFPGIEQLVVLVRFFIVGAVHSLISFILDLIPNCTVCVRFIFWNAGGLGWSIGKRDYLSSGSHWHRSM